MTLKVLDLFSGIGGFSLGLERTGGFRTVAFCEIEEFPRRVLAKHWPGVPIYHDVRELTADTLARDGISVDVICGGFPCQDVSTAGQRAGLAGARSGLWFEMARLVGELRPHFVIVENTPGLLSLGMGDVLGELAALGYDAEWECIPAAAVGANHERDRVWIVAYPDGEGEPPRALHGQMAGLSRTAGDSVRAGRAHTEGIAEAPRRPRIGTALAAAYGSRGRGEWPPEPDVVRVVDGISDRSHGPRVRALGNAVVPQIPELIGRAILAAEGLAP
jgi:DNA (cytosine-5)-methyltransferase 1